MTWSSKRNVLLQWTIQNCLIRRPASYFQKGPQTSIIKFVYRRANCGQINKRNTIGELINAELIIAELIFADEVTINLYFADWLFLRIDYFSRKTFILHYSISLNFVTNINIVLDISRNFIKKARNYIFKIYFCGLTKNKRFAEFLSAKPQ